MLPMEPPIVPLDGINLVISSFFPTHFGLLLLYLVCIKLTLASHFLPLSPGSIASSGRACMVIEGRVSQGKRGQNTPTSPVHRVCRYKHTSLPYVVEVPPFSSCRIQKYPPQPQVHSFLSFVVLLASETGRCESNKEKNTTTHNNCQNTHCALPPFTTIL